MTTTKTTRTKRKTKPTQRTTPTPSRASTTRTKSPSSSQKSSAHFFWEVVLPAPPYRVQESGESAPEVGRALSPPAIAVDQSSLTPGGRREDSRVFAIA